MAENVSKIYHSSWKDQQTKRDLCEILQNIWRKRKKHDPDDNFIIDPYPHAVEYDPEIDDTVKLASLVKKYGEDAEWYDICWPAHYSYQFDFYKSKENKKL